MSLKGVIGFRGMKSSGNELTLPAGSLVDAPNCVIPSRDELMPRRGQKLTTYVDNDPTDAHSNRAKELYQWGKHLLVHYAGSNGSEMALWKNWATAPVYQGLGSFTEPDPTVTRMKFAQLARSLFWSTAAGLYTISAAGDLARKAGLRVPHVMFSDTDGGLMTRLSGNPSATGSWLPKDTAVAYKATWGKEDANGRIIESGSSGRVVVANPKDVAIAAGSLARAGGTTVTATVPKHKFRVGDVLALSPGEANFAAGNYTVTSVTAGTVVWASAGANVVSGVIETMSSGTKSVQVVVFSDVGAGDFVRVYRTDNIAGEESDPGDEYFLAYERQSAAAGSVTIPDTTPSSFLGDPLDTNPSAEGPVNGFNQRPPLMRDVCRWDGRLFGLETTDRHRLTVRLLGTGAPNGLQSGDKFAINTRVFEAGVNFVEYEQYLATENVERTTYDMGTLLDSSLVGISAYQQHDSETTLGEVLFEQTDLGSTMADGAGGTIDAIYAGTTRASAFADPLAALKSITAASTARTLGTTVTVRCAAHGFVQGQVIMLARAVTGAVDANFPVGLKTVASVVDANNFTYTETGTNATLGGGTPYYAYATTFKSDQNKQLLRFTRQGLPEAWPLSNTPDGFPDGAEGLRIEPLPAGNGILVALKDAGFWTITGQYPYVVRPLDDSADLVAPDSLKRHAGALYALTTQGECRITEAGVGVVGQDVEASLRLAIARISDGTMNASVPFALSYESTRQYQLYVPTETAQGSGLISSTVQQAFILHSMLGQFTRWTTARTCGLVWKGGDYLVLGDPSSNQLRVERKTLTWADFADEEVACTAKDDQLAVSVIAIDTNSNPQLAHGLAGGAALIAGVYYRITASSSTSITIKGTVNVSLGDGITCFVPCAVSFTWAADSRGAPGVESRWKQLQLHFAEHLFDSPIITYKGEKSDNTGAVTVSDQNFAFGSPVFRLTTTRAKVHDNFERVELQQLKFSLTEALSYFRILGYSGSAEAITERTGA